MTLVSLAPTTDPAPMSISSPPASTPTPPEQEARKSPPATSLAAMSAPPATPREPGPTETPSAAQESETSPTHLDTDLPPMELLALAALLASLQPRREPATSSLDLDQASQEAEPPTALPPLDTPTAQEADQDQAEPLEELPMELQAALDPHTEPPPPSAELPMALQELQAHPTESPLLPQVPATEPEPHQAPPMEPVQEALSVEVVWEATNRPDTELD
jgi:hypothetical protein